MKFICENHDTLPHEKGKFLEYLYIFPELGTIAHLYKNKSIPDTIDSYAFYPNGIHNFAVAKKIVEKFVHNPQHNGPLYMTVHGDDQKAYDAIRNFYPSIPNCGEVKEFFDIIGDRPFNRIHPVREEKEDVIYESNNGTTPFMDAVKKNQYGKLNYYIDVLGVDPSAYQHIIFGDDKTPLAVAANKYTPDMFNFLVSKGARPAEGFFDDRMLDSFREDDTATAWLEAFANAKVNPRKIVYYLLRTTDSYDADKLVDRFYEKYSTPFLASANGDEKTVKNFLHTNHELVFKLSRYAETLGFHKATRAIEPLQYLITLQPAYKETILKLLEDLRFTQTSWLTFLPDSYKNWINRGNSEIDALMRKLQETTKTLVSA